MHIVSLKTGVQDGAELLRIELSDGSLLYIKSCYYHYSEAFISDEVAVHIKGVVPEGAPMAVESFCPEMFSFAVAGREISVDEEKEFRFADACYRAERIGTRLIARAEQTQAGLARKLERRGYASDCVAAVMARFIEKDLVNDERYAERWLRSRLARGNGKMNGPRWFFAALANRGIAREALKKALDKALDEEAEFTLLQRFLAKNPIGKTLETYSLRGRLRYEGFSSPVITRYFDETADENSPFKPL